MVIGGEIMKNVLMIQLRGGKKQREVANELGIPISTYAMIETGRRFPRPSLQYKIAKYYKVTVDELFFTQIDHDLWRVIT